MYTSELIFGLIFLCYSTSFTNAASRKDGDDYSRDEELLYRYFQLNNELKWPWTVEPFCRLFSPRLHVSMGGFYNRITKRELLLEGPGCKKMEVEILTCLFKNKRSRGNMWSGNKPIEYVSGLNGEIYKLGKANGICDDQHTLIITDRFRNGDDTSTSPQQPKLWGVAHLFETVNVMRDRIRQKTKDQVANKSVSDSEEDIADVATGPNLGPGGTPFMVLRVVGA